MRIFFNKSFSISLSIQEDTKINNVIETIQAHGAEIFTISITLILWILDNFWKTKVILEHSKPHEATFLIPVPVPVLDANGNQILDTNGVPMTGSGFHSIIVNSLIIKNTGRDTATNLEVVFNWKPISFSIWPIRNHTETTRLDNRHLLFFNSLAPGEIITFDILAASGSPSIPALMPSLLSIRCDQCVSQYKEMSPQLVTSKRSKKIHKILEIIGTGVVIYFFTIAVQFLLFQTP